MNAAGTLYASPRNTIPRFVGGLALGAGMLAIVVVSLSALSWLLPLDQGPRNVAVAVLLGAFAFSEWVGGWHRKLSFRWLVPTEFVNMNNADAVTRWGRALGFGFLTDAPYGVFHVALAVPVVLGDVFLALAAVVAFAGARAIPYLVAPIGRNALEIGDVAFKGRSVVFQAARVLSLATVTAAFVWALVP
ncbi:hypothetical protein GCM10009850_026200 [Nonomuraea monospora]|uniref:Uncharacterized protein n=1 Tax=Nonomuraea monospora TaxID=568818 RepID=A0ABN3CCQ8_9ACTN